MKTGGLLSNGMQISCILSQEILKTHSFSTELFNKLMEVRMSSGHHGWKWK